MRGIVQARDYLGHPEGITGHPGGDDVGAVVRREGDERLRMRDPCRLEHARGDAIPGHEAAAESSRQPAPDGILELDDGDLVAFRVEPDRQRPAGPPASHDDDLHGSSLPGGGLPAGRS